MIIISKEIQDFLKFFGDESELRITQIPKSRSSIRIGDVLLFRYDLSKEGLGRGFRMVLVVRPVIKEPGTGNLLLSAVKVYPPFEIEPAALIDLYKNRSSIPEENYRTYRLNRMYGPLLRILTLAEI